MGYLENYREPIYPDQKWYCPHCYAENLDNPETILLMCRNCQADALDWSEVLPESPVKCRTCGDTGRAHQTLTDPDGTACPDCHP
jgi:hypothetical protein